MKKFIPLFVVTLAVVLFFNGKKIFHTDLQALGESSPRYTLNIFYTKPKF